MEILAGARKHDRLAASILLVSLAFLVGVLVLDVYVFRVSDRLINIYNGRWSQYIDRGERLLAEGRYEEAVAYLQDLDHRFPARHAKHALDQERERVLLALGRAYEKTGRRRRARETFAQLTLFDPRNFLNHFELAECLVRQNRRVEALAPLGRVVEINPSHLPSVRLLVDVYFENGAWSDVVRVWEHYLDALVFADVRLVWESEETTLQVPVDGEFHQLEVSSSGSLDREPGPGGLASLTVQGFPFELREVQARPRMRSDPSETTDFQVAEIASGQQVPRNGVLFVPRSSEEGVQLELEAHQASVDRWRLCIRLLKLGDIETWRRVTKSYRNLLDLDGLEEARMRSLPPAGDSG